MNQNTLITGASGFVGGNLLNFLKQESIEAQEFDRRQLTENPIILSENVLSIIHLAGKAHDLKNVSSPDEYYDVNFQLTKNLYDAFLKSSAQKFIFISSVKAAADSLDSILTEDSKPSPHTHYGKSKLMAEEYIQQQPLPIGKQYYILRPCMIHGPGNKGNLNLLYKLVKKGIPYPLAAFENERSFLSVINLCFIIKGLLAYHVPSGIYNVADDKTLSTNEVIELIAKALSVKSKLWKINSNLISFIAKLGDSLGLPLNSERLQKLTENYVVSNKKIKQALNLSELPISSRQGLSDTINSFEK